MCSDQSRFYERKLSKCLSEFTQFIMLLRLVILGSTAGCLCEKVIAVVFLELNVTFYLLAQSSILTKPLFNILVVSLILIADASKVVISASSNTSDYSPLNILLI